MSLPFVFRGIVLPEHLRESIDRYVEHGVPTGGFLEAVIDNNLAQSINRADEKCLPLIPAIVGYFYTRCPAGCWGYPGAFERWLGRKRKERDAQRDAHVGSTRE